MREDPPCTWTRRPVGRSQRFRHPSCRVEGRKRGGYMSKCRTKDTCDPGPDTSPTEESLDFKAWSPTGLFGSARWRYLFCEVQVQVLRIDHKGLPNHCLSSCSFHHRSNLGHYLGHLSHLWTNSGQEILGVLRRFVPPHQLHTGERDRAFRALLGVAKVKLPGVPSPSQQLQRAPRIPPKG